ncbi:probable inactive receptor kinase At4g23740 [Cynara cardunculus var. scolymus]|uniref:Leucine-rich repeat-containing protein n=1 Tax=Cynara cardunculus var. scolymus TaxID=59895 RepID=A0A103Y8W5_CYNCS|nr:probable inactive receptor kinase At4g23740 [Cynara cardunculus var. scolymus]KVI04676.1 Leucine-rich repeat-containing protein [Cynara cardunculus var. scolymus]
MVNINNDFLFVALVFFATLFSLVATEPIQDKKTLLHFIQNIPHSRVINWHINSSACSNWTGVTCDHHRSSIISIRLPALSLRGPIPPNTLGRLSNLQILSLRSNGLSGPFPSDLVNLRNLTALHLQCNGFYGPLPSDLSVWNNLSLLNLSNNGFNGTISRSISSLTHLTALSLANNSLSGEIPDFSTASLRLLDLSSNNLTGTVPHSLKRFPSSAFLGNNLAPESSLLPTFSPTGQAPRKSSKLGEPAILGIVIGGCVLALGLLALLMVLRYSKKEGRNKDLQGSDMKEKGTEKLRSRSQNGNGNLVFFEGSNLAFNLEDLFRASAEVLGKGSFGTTYKASLEDSSAVVVKRLKDVNAGRRDFEQQMEIVGSIRHDNVVPLRAYYYSKDEKLMVYDYFNQGSVSSLLHAKRGASRTPLDWESRLRIAVGAARGITHIHTQASGKLVHGNIKASNIFLNSHRYGCVSDLGLAVMMSPMVAPVMRTGGYQSPEIIDTRKVYQASDVYSFGVLLFELLTGKSPTHATCGNEVVHLVRWVQSVVQEEWTAEVFDVELLRYPDIEEEMVEMLQIGMQCVTKSPEQRPKMAEVVKLVENIRTGARRL